MNETAPSENLPLMKKTLPPENSARTAARGRAQSAMEAFDVRTGMTRAWARSMCGRPVYALEKHPRRRIVDAVLYLARTGSSAWRTLTRSA
ncbi:hypothetical protein [Streptomyces mirabilis]|uniref:hypothetical protein n=1 Tax=Streptomyces mirabilis TaxID=68239 RepID=UPI003687513D